MNDISNEELQQELAEMEAIGKHSLPHKGINRKVNRRRNYRRIAVAVVTISLLLCLYVWLRGAVGTALGDGGAYQIKIGGFDENSLQLSFDPTFNESYLSLSGLGYGNVDSIEGGSLLEKLAMNTTMFDKFKHLAENDDMASIYDGAFGQANFDQYYANKFYLRNVGDGIVTYRINLEISENTNNALSAARFMLVTGDAVNGYEYRIYATPDRSVDEFGNAILDEDDNEIFEQAIAAFAYSTSAMEANKKIYFADPNVSDTLTTDDVNAAWRCTNLVENADTLFWNYFSCTFDDEGNIYNESGELLDESTLNADNGVYTLLPGQSACYTLCVWYEGSDPDHNNSIANGGIEFTIFFEPFNSEQLEVDRETK